MSKQNNIYNVVPVETPKQNVFDLTHQVLGTADYGHMIPMKPVFCMPGDKMRTSYEILIRCNPLAAPAMQRIWATIHCWYVPHRIVWPNFEEWIDYIKTGGNLPAFPYINLTQGRWNANNILMDNMGIGDPGITNTFHISAIPFAAYQLIYNTKYRDQNLVTTNLWDDKTGLVDGDNSTEQGLLQLRLRAWAHDYFTSNLPTAQKGDPVELPVGSFAENVEVFRNTPGSTPDTTINTTAGTSPLTVIAQSTAGIPNEHLYAETLGATLSAITMNDLRTAEALQKWLEMIERSGSRYEELLNAAFNVRIRDERINRPEYVGGTMSPVMISEVLQTSESAGGTPQGNMAGHGVSVTSGGYGNFHAPEFGYMIPILTIMPEANYSNAIQRHWSLIDHPTDFPWPQFAQLGEQTTRNRELDPQHTAPNDTFGYLPRYQEHRNIPNQVNAMFLDLYPHWSESRILLGTDPALNQAFIECDPNGDIFAAPTAQNFVFNFMHKIHAIRSLPKFGIPSLK